MNEEASKKTEIRLGVVDEQEEDVVEFFSYFDDYFIPIEIEIGINTEDAIQDIINKNVDAVAIDYYLKEHNDQILYNGNDLFKEVLSQLNGFPCFLMTSYPDEAKKHNIDQFRIFSKNVMQPDPDMIVEHEKGKELVSRIKQAVYTYKKEITEKENRIIELIELSNQRDLNYAEEEELIELDTFLEKIHDGRSSIPENLKTKSNDELLSNLLLKADEIISKINEKK